MAKYSPFLLLLFGNEILSLAVLTIYTAVFVCKAVKPIILADLDKKLEEMKEEQNG